MSGYLAAGSLILAAVGTAATVSGQMNAQSAAGAQANYMRQVQQQQQQVAQQQAADALKRGDIAEQKNREATGQRIGTQTAALAGQGTDLSGSPTDILTDTRRAGELDALTVRNNAAREAWGYQVQGSNAGAGAALYGSFQPSYLGAGASLLSGASGLADKWSKFKYNSGDSSGGSYGLDPVASAGYGGNPTAGV